MRGIITIIWMLMAGAVSAESVVPTSAIRPRSVITEDMVAVVKKDLRGGLSALSDVVGMEARVALYPGRAIRAEDIGAPAVIERNQVVQLIYQSAGLEILTDGRAMGRGAVGEVLRVMNLSSRSTVVGTVRPDRSILVQH
ncbi:flagellar basal body P-ring formation chaperone FlgA [Cognatishimia sp. 1_MG-2023]|uniref:flagellar basal body P-ring formation chaperone FlgA n=1 Tax=Cognatishimia sp. 1_MG-2023 TaxID=3062642 RepID=UPI0026E47F02|nr:flagellar basal body P-ring formation chaperone FlgA [Cognatishimia sp. 1_MG-2023]MDO6726937.1 flagellar basal body P-ring formation chaperone FlgA [Cognatishimia sp. 1_MG-2023]